MDPFTAQKFASLVNKYGGSGVGPPTEEDGGLSDDNEYAPHSPKYLV